MDKRGKKKSLYTIYEKRNGSLIIKEGTEEECVEALGYKSISSFQSIVRTSKYQEIPKYDITKIKWCKACGERFEIKNGNSSICTDCKAAVGKWDEEFKAKKQALREAKKKRRAEEAKKARELKINKKKCATCLYRMHICDGEKQWYCGYCFYTGHKRPCDISPKCVVYEVYDEKKRKLLTSNLKNSG